MIYSLIRGEENFSTVVSQRLSKSEATGADTCRDDSNCVNNCAESASNSSCTVEGKVKFHPKKTTKAQRGSRYIALHFL